MTDPAYSSERMPVDVEHLRSRADDMHAGGLIVQAAEMRGAADEIRRLQAEVATLQRWKAEAATVLGYWENAYERAQIPGHLGEYKPTVMLAEIERLRGAITLACSGWKNPDDAVAYWLRKAGEAAASSTATNPYRHDQASPGRPAMSEPDFRRMGDPLNDRLPPKVRPDRGLIQSADDMSPDQIAAHNATRASGCSHGTFEAAVQVGRMFDSDEAIAAGGDPDSVTVEVRAWCLECGKAVRFEGPIGVSVGPGARPMVSLDGRELRATGHLGENRTPSITARLTSTPSEVQP